MAEKTVPAPSTDALCAPFGMLSIDLAVSNEADHQEVTQDAYWLAHRALAVFEAIADGEGKEHPLHYSGLYLLRQAVAVLQVAQSRPDVAPPTR